MVSLLEIKIHQNVYPSYILHTDIVTNPYCNIHQYRLSLPIRPSKTGRVRVYILPTVSEVYAQPAVLSHRLQDTLYTVCTPKLYVCKRHAAFNLQRVIYCFNSHLYTRGRSPIAWSNIDCRLSASNPQGIRIFVEESDSSDSLVCVPEIGQTGHEWSIV